MNMLQYGILWIVAVIFCFLLVIIASNSNEKGCINGAMNEDSEVSSKTIQWCFDTF